MLRGKDVPSFVSLLTQNCYLAVLVAGNYGGHRNLEI